MAASHENIAWEDDDLRELWNDLNYLAPAPIVPELLMEGDEADQPIPPQQHQVEPPGVPTYEMIAGSNRNTYHESTASLDDEDTCDVADLNMPDAASPSQPFPPQQHQVVQQIVMETPMEEPRGDASPGSLNFHVWFDDKYISATKQFYTRMMEPFAVKMMWDWIETDRPLIVNATMQFVEEKYSNEKVQCCTQHCAGTEEVCKHFLRSTCSDAHAVSYCGDLERPGSRLSVAVLFPAKPEPGQKYFSHTYQFHCMGTCATGVHGRPIQILFTLENNGVVLERQTVGVTVHKTPCRPYNKALKNLGIEVTERRGTKRRCVVVERLDDAKIVKLEVATPELSLPNPSPADPDIGIYTLPAIQISGAGNFKHILDCIKMSLKAKMYEAPNEIKEVCLRGIRDCETAEREQMLKEEAPGD